MVTDWVGRSGPVRPEWWAGGPVGWGEEGMPAQLIDSFSYLVEKTL